MQYILSISFNDGEHYYVRDNGDGTWDEIYTPYRATMFPAKKTALKWANDNTTMSEYISCVNAATACKRFDDWANKGMIRRSFPVVDKIFSRKYDPTIDSPIDVLKWRVYAKEHDGLIKFEDYRTWPELYQVFSYLFGVESYHSEDYSKLYHTVRISVGKNGKYQDFETEFLKATQFVTFIDNGGFLRFSIFEDDLSETRNPVLYFKALDNCYVANERYGKTKYITGTLEKCFEYIRHNLYYSR